MTQILSVATLVGDAAIFVRDLFARWQELPDPAGVDRFGIALRENKLVPPVVYFAEWLDTWSMFDTVPGPRAAEGRNFQAACFQPDEAIQWANTRSTQFPEYLWFGARLREATTVWSGNSEAIIVLRDMIGASWSDDEIKPALVGVPEWLSSMS